MTSFRRHTHLLEGQHCPSCGLKYEFCEIEDCDNFALYEGWIKCGIMLQRRHLCRKHATFFEGYKTKGEKVFEEAHNERN